MLNKFGLARILISIGMNRFFAPTTKQYSNLLEVPASPSGRRPYRRALSFTSILLDRSERSTRTVNDEPPIKKSVQISPYVVVHSEDSPQPTMEKMSTKGEKQMKSLAKDKKRKKKKKKKRILLRSASARLANSSETENEKFGLRLRYDTSQSDSDLQRESRSTKCAFESIVANGTEKKSDGHLDENPHADPTLLEESPSSKYSEEFEQMWSTVESLESDRTKSNIGGAKSNATIVGKDYSNRRRVVSFDDYDYIAPQTPISFEGDNDESDGEVKSLGGKKKKSKKSKKSDRKSRHKEAESQSTSLSDHLGQEEESRSVHGNDRLVRSFVSHGEKELPSHHRSRSGEKELRRSQSCRSVQERQASQQSLVNLGEQEDLETVHDLVSKLMPMLDGLIRLQDEVGKSAPVVPNDSQCNLPESLADINPTVFPVNAVSDPSSTRYLSVMTTSQNELDSAAPQKSQPMAEKVPPVKSVDFSQEVTPEEDTTADETISTLNESMENELADLRARLDLHENSIRYDSATARQAASIATSYSEMQQRLAQQEARVVRLTEKLEAAMEDLDRMRHDLQDTLMQPNDAKLLQASVKNGKAKIKGIVKQDALLHPNDAKELQALVQDDTAKIKGIVKLGQEQIKRAEGGQVSEINEPQDVATKEEKQKQRQVSQEYLKVVQVNNLKWKEENDASKLQTMKEIDENEEIDAQIVLDKTAQEADGTFDKQPENMSTALNQKQIKRNLAKVAQAVVSKWNAEANAALTVPEKEFQSHFRMTKDEFKKLPRWRKMSSYKKR